MWSADGLKQLKQSNNPASTFSRVPSFAAFAAAASGLFPDEDDVTKVVRA